jgi:hypothetical protein
VRRLPKPLNTRPGTKSSGRDGGSNPPSRINKIYDNMPRNQKIGEKRIELRQRMFPHVVDADLWIRQKSTGFTTVPRGLPLILTLMDKLSKGKPLSSTYFELWCRMFDESFINLKPREMAFHAGFSGQRAEQTWSERMKILAKLKFIETKPGAEGELSYAVVFNPYKVIKSHFENAKGGLDAAYYNSLVQRMSEIGAKDFDEPKPVIEEVATPPSKVPPRPLLPQRKLVLPKSAGH